MKKSNGCLFSAYYSKEVSQYHLCWQDSKVGRGVGKHYSGKREGFKHALIRDCYPEEDVGGITRSGKSYVVG